jgi:gamma-glutamylcyclotransferase (GGCT)/AIG2-like uncharacterized protein YtfP
MSAAGQSGKIITSEGRGVEPGGNDMEQLPFFVYGTLLPGEANYHLWGDAIRREETAVFPNGRLYDLGGYPMMLEEGDAPVRGALIYVHPAAYAAILARLDALEGYNPERPDASPYQRRRRRALTEAGTAVTAWVYLGRRRYVRHRPVIESGDWVAARRRRQR